MAKDRTATLVASLEREKQERAEADERADRANERARQADEAYRKLHLELVTAKDDAAAAKDEIKHLQDKVATFEADLQRLRESSEAAVASAAAATEAFKAASIAPGSLAPSSRNTESPPTKPSDKPPSDTKGPTFPPLVPIPVIIENRPEVSAKVESMLARIEGLREMLATAAIELSQLNADEVALAKRRSRVLTDACALLARAVGATGQAPPPIPSKSLEARLSIAPVVDISEVADLIESLRPPRSPKVE